MSSSFKQLKETEIQIVHDWLRTMGMSVNRLLNREYADGFLIARLLKKMYPQLVNIHCYQRSYSYDVKTTNWRTLNFKVLRRIGLSLTDEQIQSLVNGEQGSIEQFMWTIMNYCIDGKKFKTTPRRKSPFFKKSIKPKNEKTMKGKEIETETAMEATATKPYIKNEKKTLDETTKQPETPTILVCSSSAEEYKNSKNLEISHKLPESFEEEKEKVHLKIENVNYEYELEKAKARVEELEHIIAQQDEILKILKERARAYESENQEFGKIIALIKRVYTL